MKTAESSGLFLVPRKNKFWSVLKENRWLYLMLAPAILSQIAFAYLPMSKMVIAFRNVDEFHLPYGTRWVGWQNFYFLTDPYFWQTLRNTVVIAGLKLLICFPAPIILALLLNEVHHPRFKKVIQTISYLPHFISWVIIANIIDRLLNTNTGLVNGIITAFGGEAIHFMGSTKWFLPIVILSNLWKEVGFSSIVYLAAMTQINPDLYEAAEVDGAGKFARIKYVTLPGIYPMISMMLVLSIPNLINAGFDQIYLLHNPLNQPVSEILDIYILKSGLSYGDFAKAAAMGICNSLVSLILIIIANKGSGKLGGSTIW